MKHPLLNPESSHYSMFDGVEAIERMEQMFSREELMAWAKLSAMKYRLRIGRKGPAAEDAKKIQTYEAYYKYLKESVAQPENEKVCFFCKWWKDEVCTNGDSDYAADFKEKADTCSFFEGFDDKQ